MPAAPLAWWRQPYFDGNGDPLASGSVEFYESGTSTPLAVYTDPDLSVSAGTTVSLNSAGLPVVTGNEVTLFPLPRAYRVVLKNSAGATVVTRDGVYALQAASSVNLDISDAVFGEAVSAGDGVYLSDGSNSLTAGRWYKWDADLYYASIHPQLGFATAAADIAATGTVRIGGVITGLSGLTAGVTYYVSGTAAALTATAPMNARSVGVAISTTTIRIDFGPAWLANSDPLSICDGRLTLTTATPVTTADVTGAGTLYFTPYTGNRVALFDGSKWKVYAFTEVSLAITATSGFNYDVWLYDNAGTLTLETLIWTNDTTRATALALQNGVPVKTGVTTRRYLGTFRASGSNTIEDSFAKRFLSNYYNRVRKGMRNATETANSWTYTLAAFQQANANAANQLAFVVGVAEVMVEALVYAVASSDAAGRVMTVAIGADSTSAAATGCLMGGVESQVANRQVPIVSFLRTFPAVGYHYLAWLEYSTAAGTTTWVGDANTPTIAQTGITGSIDC